MQISFVNNFVQNEHFSAKLEKKLETDAIYAQVRTRKKKRPAPLPPPIQKRASETVIPAQDIDSQNESLSTIDEMSSIEIKHKAEIGTPNNNVQDCPVSDTDKLVENNCGEVNDNIKNESRVKNNCIEVNDNGELSIDSDSRIIDKNNDTSINESNTKVETIGENNITQEHDKIDAKEEAIINEIDGFTIIDDTDLNNNNDTEKEQSKTNEKNCVEICKSENKLNGIKQKCENTICAY